MYAKLKRYLEISNQIKSLEKEAESLKKEIKSNYADGNFVINDVLLQVTSQMRETINKEALIEAYGIATISKYTKISEYKIIQVKSIDKE